MSEVCQYLETRYQSKEKRNFFIQCTLIERFWDDYYTIKTGKLQQNIMLVPVTKFLQYERISAKINISATRKLFPERNEESKNDESILTIGIKL